MGNDDEEGEEEMVETVDFSKPVSKEQIKCRYPNCEKDGIIPTFEDDIINLRKVIPYCNEHAIIIQREKEKKKLREEILEMKKEGII